MRICFGLHRLKLFNYYFRNSVSICANDIRCFSRTFHLHHKLYSLNINANNAERFILENTVITSDHLTPELKLRLITPECRLWTASAEECEVDDPFWGFYWPGGQVLTRFLLDNPSYVRGKQVLDLGSGCGASAIAAVKLGAKHVLANDIDIVAEKAMQINAQLNHVDMETSSKDLIGRTDMSWDTVLLGDMFYDLDFTTLVTDWLMALVSKTKCCILIGDPGRVFLSQHPIRGHLHKLAQYNLPERCKEENHGFSEAAVWKLQ